MSPDHTFSLKKYFSPGQQASSVKQITESDVVAFANLTGDTQSIHMDPKYGLKTRFGKQIAHGTILIGLISAVLGKEMGHPEYTVIFLGTKVNFTNPVFLGDEIEATCTVKTIRPDKPIVTLDCTCINQSGKEVMNGEAVVYIDPYPKT